MNSILVRAPNWIGDQIIAFPFFYELRKRYPRARIGVLCANWVSSIQFQNLVDEVWVLPKPASSSLVDRFRALEAAAAIARMKGPWDLGISLPDSFSSAWILFRAGCRRRVGYAGDARSFLLTDRLKKSAKDGLHRAESYGQLFSLFGEPAKWGHFWGVPPENDLDPGIPGVLAEFPVERAWPTAVPIEPLPESQAPQYFVLAPGSVAESRRWSVERFFVLAEKVIEETGWHCLIVGGPGEKAAAEKLLRLADESPVCAGKIHDFTGKGGVSATWKIFRRAQFSICNDSGLAHVAALCGSPVQIVWGAGDPRRTAPLGPGRVKFKVNVVDCWPCERNVCYKEGAERVACLTGIDPDELWKEMKLGLHLRTSKSDST